MKNPRQRIRWNFVRGVTNSAWNDRGGIGTETFKLVGKTTGEQLNHNVIIRNQWKSWKASSRLSWSSRTLGLGSLAWAGNRRERERKRAAATKPNMDHNIELENYKCFRDILELLGGFFKKISYLKISKGDLKSDLKKERLNSVQNCDMKIWLLCMYAGQA